MFKVSALTGFGGGGGGPVALVGSVAGNVSTTDAATHALGNIDVGVASADKKIILIFTWEDQVSITASSVTVGGVSLAQKASVLNGTNPYMGTAIWTGNIASINGSSAISITLSGNVESVGVSGVAVSGLQSLTPTMSDTDFSEGSTTQTITSLAAPANGFAIAASAQQSRTNTASWSSLTEKADLETGGGGDDHRHTAAWDFGERTAANEIVTWSGSNNVSAAGAGFR